MVLDAMKANGKYNKVAVTIPNKNCFRSFT